jgi:FMN reductase (NADPH)
MLEFEVMLESAPSLEKRIVARGWDAQVRVDFHAMNSETFIPDPRLELFDHHRTIRKFKPEPMKPGDLENIVWAAQRAPTDATAQMYSFLRLTDPDVRSEVAQITHNPHFATAAESFIVLADVHRLQRLLEHRGYTFADWPATAIHFAIGDAVMAGQNMLIAAEMLGYQGCWIGGVLSALERIVELCELPHGVIPFAGLVIGVPDEHPAQRPRIQPELVIHENRYRQPDAHDLETALEITARGDWAQTLSRYFAQGGTMEAREVTLKRVLAQQGFDHVASNLDALFGRVLEAGFAEILIRRAGDGFEAWVDRPDRAHRGEGSSPSVALEMAVLTAEKDG